MNNSFEHKIQGKLQNLEGRVEKKTWKNIAQKLDHPFETALKSRLNSFEPLVGATSLWSGIASELPNSLEKNLQNKFQNFETIPSTAVWQGITQSVESMPGNFEQKMAQKMGSFASIAPENGMNAVFTKIDKKNIFQLKRTIASIAAVFLLFSTFLFIPKNAQLPLANNNSAIGNYENANALANDNKNNDHSTSELNKQINDKDLADKSLINSANNVEGNSSEMLHTAQTNMEKKKGLKGMTRMDEFNPLVLDQIALNKLEGVDLIFKTLKQHVLEVNIFVVEIPKKDPILVGLYASIGSFTLNSRSNSGLDMYNDDFAQFQNKLYTKGRYATIGANLSMPISEKINLTTGVSITSAKQNIEFALFKKDVPSSYNSLTNNGSIITSSYNPNSSLLSNKKSNNESYLAVIDNSEMAGDSIIAGNAFSVTNSFLMIDLPVGIETKLIEKEKSNLSLRIGGKFRIMAGANTFHITPDRNHIVEVNSAMSQVFYQSSLVGYTGISYNIQVNDNLEISVGPEVNVNFSDINRTGTWMSMRPFLIGLNVGIRQKD